MADLNKPKETVAVKPAEDRPPETEEERQKRLRKEERRKLRVSWKPDESLTEIRLFTHDPEEELNPEDGSLNGVGASVKSEGDALRLHKDKEVEADDEELGGIREVELHDYQTLSSKLDFYASFTPSHKIDFEPAIDIDSEELKNSNFVKRGGNRQPISAEKDAQDHREATTLMVFYSSPDEVPSTPKEPPATDEDEVATEVVDFGELPESVKVLTFPRYSLNAAYSLDKSRPNRSSTTLTSIPSLLFRLNHSNSQILLRQMAGSISVTC